MILYLCSNRNFNLFDFLEQDHGMAVKKMSGVFKLKQFVIHDVRNLSQFSFFVIDLKAVRDAENEIIEAITAFSAMYSARVIIFAEGYDGSSPLIAKLIDLGFYNIITSIEFEEIKEEMLECISPEGKDIHSAIKGKYFSGEDIIRQNRTEYTFICRDVKVAVAGTACKVGTTTTAFNLANFLSNNGADVAYVEANSNEHLKYLPAFYKDMSVNETYIERSGVKYYLKGNFPQENNFTVIDFGVVDYSMLHAIKKCELIILCGTTKPYEVDCVKTVLKDFDGLPVNVVLSHTPKKSQNEIMKMLGNENLRIYFANSSPDLFDGKVNEKIFTEVLRDYRQVKPDE